MEQLVYQAHEVTDLLALEESRRSGPLNSWEALMTADATSTFFQGPVWCMTWYRSFSDSFHPLVIFVTCDGTLVGIAPLAVEKSAKRLTFAGDNMADYRDVVAVGGCREFIIAKLLRVYCSGAFSSPFRVGPTQPESETTSIILRLSGRSSGVWSIVRSHPCWRLWFRESDTLEKVIKKESVRRHLNYYKRQGPVLLERVDTREAWDKVRQVFFDHHSLRQLHAGRSMSFNDPRKKSFYDALVSEDSSSVHISVLRVAGRIIAEHYGYLWREVIYWGAPAFDTREVKHSPGQILLALLLQNAAANGFRGVDFTLGDEEFKKRFGNDCATVLSIDTYSWAGMYWVQKVRDATVASAKRVVLSVAGEHTWNHTRQRVKSVLSRIPRISQVGLGTVVSRLINRLLA